MKKYIILLLSIFTLSTLKAQVADFDLLLGVNRTELHNLPTLDAQLAMLDDIKASGCEAVRLTISRTAYREVVSKQIVHCNEIGLKVMLVMKLGAVYEMYTKGTKLRPKSSFYNVFEHSQLNPVRYRTWFTNTLHLIRKFGGKVDVIEVGNEVGWTDFNADLPIFEKGEGVVFDESYDWNTLPVKVREGMRKVGQMARISKQVVNELYAKSSTQPKVIVGGFNLFHDTTWMKNKGGSIIKPNLALQIMKGTLKGQPECENYLKMLDGVSVHMYPAGKCPYNANFETMVDNSVRYIDTWMEDITKETKLPMYLSEFGFRVETYGAANDEKRLEQYKAFMEGLRRTAPKYDWRQAHIFSWDGGMSYMWANGKELKATAIFRE